MSQVLLDLSSEDCEEVIIALAMRRQQVGLIPEHGYEIERIGDALADAMGPVFGWEPGLGLNLFRAHLRQWRKVRVS